MLHLKRFEVGFIPSNACITSTIISPYSESLQRALKREKKYYYWDWSEVKDESARFENIIISHLLKTCHTWSDFGLGEFELWYVRDREKREVDALVTRDNQPWMLVEVKLNDLNVSKSLERFARLLNCNKIVQVVGPDNVYRQVRVGKQICMPLETTYVEQYH